jgi:hypothetical protein
MWSYEKLDLEQSLSFWISYQLESQILSSYVFGPLRY